MRIRLAILVIIFISICSQVICQENKNNRISISLIQFQPNQRSRLFDLDPILMLGVGYERIFKINFGMITNLSYKVGKVEARSFSIGSLAMADLQELNFKFGLIRYFAIVRSLTLPVKIQYFQEHSSYENNTQNFIIVGAGETDFFKDTKYRGLETGIGLDLTIGNRFSLFGFGGFQIGVLGKFKSFRRKMIVTNLPIIEELGVKYKF